MVPIADRLLGRSRVWLGRSRVWLGPLAAAVFMLRGMAVLMPLALVVAVVLGTRRTQRGRMVPSVAALLLFAAPVTGWVGLRSPAM